MSVRVVHLQGKRWSYERIGTRVSTHTTSVSSHRRKYSRAIKIFLYHRIVPNNHALAENPLCVSEHDFRRQLELLDRWGFTSITFEDYRLFLEGRLDLPRKAIIITFDDGYEDTYALAFPLLKEFGMKAVVFVLGDRRITTNIWDSVGGELASSRLLDDKQILELHQSGFEIGAHTLTHARLPMLPKEKAWEEISRSRMFLETLLNGPVRTFAYPYGLVNNIVKEMVREAGFLFACGAFSGPVCMDQDYFEIRRILVSGNDNAMRFLLKVLAPYENYRWFWWKSREEIRKIYLSGKNGRPESDQQATHSTIESIPQKSSDRNQP